MKNKIYKKISEFTSIGVGGECRGIFLPETTEEFIKIMQDFDKQSIPYKVIGNGTNLLFSDEFQDYIVISTRKIAKKMSKRNNYVNFSSSVNLFDAYNFCLKNNLSGFEKLASIPGNIGGAIASGASCYGVSIFDNLKNISIYHNGEVRTVSIKQLKKSYHSSCFLENTFIRPKIILSAKFELQVNNPCTIQKTYLNYISKRILTQPYGRSFGCVFKNINGLSAGKLLDECGLKGLQKNDAFISDKHANFIINKSKASFNDIYFLIQTMENKIKEKYNITLEKDVEIIK